LSKSIQVSNVMKIRPVVAEFHADRRTDMMRLIVAFRNSANAAKTHYGFIESVKMVGSNDSEIFKFYPFYLFIVLISY
jgi:hypothetical protein